MKERREAISTILGRLTWISIGLGILYWAVETAIDVWGFRSGDFIGRLFAPPYALIRRLLILGTFIALGVYFQVLTAGRRRAEQAAQRGHDITQKYLQVVGTIIVALDADGRITLLNRKACEVLGYEEHELVGKDWFATCLPQRVRGEARAIFDRLIAGEIEPAEYFENPILTRSGEERLVSWHNSVLTDEAGRVIGTLSSGEDVTERRRAEALLLESEEKYRNLVERANDGIIIVQDGLIKYLNRYWAETWGGTIEEILNTPVFDYVHPESRAQVMAHYEQRLAGLDVPPVYEVTLLRKDGSSLYAELNAGVITYQGRPADLVIVRNITERKQAEKALEESEERFRKQFEEALDAIFVADAETGILIDCNRAACALVGREKSDLVGQHQRILHPPEEIEGEFSRTFKEHQKRTEHLLETKVITKEGQIRDVAIKANLFEIGGRKVLQGIFRDITERKRAEEALAQRAAQLALLADIGRQIAAVTDLNTVLERAAHLVQERFGYHHAALFTLDRETGELVMRARSGKFAHLFPLDHRLKLGQGMVGWVGSRGETLLANDVDAEPRYVNLYPGIVPTKAELTVPIRVGREIVGVLDVQSDRPNAFGENDVMVLETLADQIAVAIENARLYERVRAGEESERRFRERLAALHELSIELSKAPTFDDLCRQAVELGRSRLGFDRLGIWFLDKDPQFIVGSFGTDEQGQVRDERGRRLAPSPESAGALIFSGQVPLVFEPDTPLHDDKGVVVGRGWQAVAAMRDADRVIGYISADNLLRGLPADEHQLEILKLYGITLGHLCTRKRAEEALAQKAQELARSNADLEHFAYVASHDLQEPLRMVRSYLQLLERRYKEQLDADAREFIAYAVDGATRMQNLISALLSYSRVGTRGKPFEPTDCSTVLERVLDNLKVAIEESNAVVTHDPLPTVMADNVQLAQVFQNLIGNAVKFHGERPPAVHVGAQRGKGEWIFSVRDNGIGIDPQHFERIFLIFQRLHSQDEYPGAGIGLAVCKKIVERHGGRMWVESQPGAGSTFYFTIPDRGGTP